MKNRSCPNKDVCWYYEVSNCKGCATGEKIARLARQNKKLKAENADLQKRLENALELPRLEISPYDDNDTLLYYLKNGHIQQECFNNKHPEQLQKRLAELKGEKK